MRNNIHYPKHRSESLHLRSSFNEPDNFFDYYCDADQRKKIQMDTGGTVPEYRKTPNVK